MDFGGQGRFCGKYFNKPGHLIIGNAISVTQKDKAFNSSIFCPIVFKLIKYELFIFYIHGDAAHFFNTITTIN